LHIRIGINTGYGTVGNFGSDNRLDYTIVGGQVNLASRLESFAEIDNILISFSTYALVKDQVTCIQMGDVKAKGFEKSIRTYKVVDTVENLDRQSKLSAAPTV
jgi:adenylate cyclase